MASQTQADPNVEVVESIYDAFVSGDVPALLERFDQDIEIRQSAELPWGGTFRGHDGALQFLAALTRHIQTEVEVERMIAAGDTVIEIGRTQGRAVDSGREFSIDEIHVWRLRDGRAVALEAYVDNEAMKAALAR